MSHIRRRVVHITVELSIDISVSEREARRFVAEGIDKHRAELPQWMALASTPKVIVLSYKQVGQLQ